MIQEASYDDILLLRQEVMYPDQNLDFAKLADDANGIHIGYYDNGQLASVVSLFLEGRDLQFRKLATREKYQNRGYASKILDWIIEYATDIRFDKVWCNAREEKLLFYTNRGFIETEHKFQKNGFNYIVVEKKLTP